MDLKIYIVKIDNKKVVLGYEKSLIIDGEKFTIINKNKLKTYKNCEKSILELRKTLNEDILNKILEYWQ